MSVAGEDLLCVPGDRLCGGEGRAPGYGTYLSGGAIYSSLAGEVSYSLHPDDTSITVVSVEVRGEARVKIRPGCRVTCRVGAVHWFYATCHILCVEEVVLPAPITARLRKEDIQAVDKDSTYVGHCVRHGDVLLARVVSIEERQHWRITTEEADLGVVMARSRAGHLMAPISWTEMKCPVTGEVEKRKVAKIPTSLAT